ncbi:MAG: glycosyltransferase, partial [Terriglobales bacterium]
RRLLRSPWPWLGVLIAFLFALPNLIWQMQHDWPTWELLNNVKNSSKNIVVGPVEYFGQQILLMNAIEFPLWFAGLLWLLLSGKARPFRALAWTYVAAFVIFVALKGKHYYLAPTYPMLIAAGSVFLEDIVERLRRPWVVAAYAGLIAATGALLSPLVLPVLPPEQVEAYMQAIHITPPRTERSHTAALPQVFADQFGWQELSDSVAAVVQSLPPEDQRRVRIFGQNYGEAAAIDILGRKHALPPAISGHQNYYYWGPRGATRDIIIVLDDNPGSLPEICGSVEDKGPIQSHPLAMPYEQELHIYICRDMKVSPEEVWPKVKKWL